MPCIFFNLDEKIVQKVRKEIENLSAIWRTCKRQCIEFITNNEESTEGAITLKKCLKGEGALEIYSDEAAIKGVDCIWPETGQEAQGYPWKLGWKEWRRERWHAS
jgi:hypothetical protein